MTARSSGRVDANQSAIVDACRQVGMEVYIMSAHPRHPFDLLIGYHDILLAFEVKNKSDAKLTERESEFKDKFGRVGVRIYQVSSFEEVERVFNYEKYERIIK